MIPTPGSDTFTQCGAGKYQNSEGATTPDQCVDCLAGIVVPQYYYCSSEREVFKGTSSKYCLS